MAKKGVKLRRWVEKLPVPGLLWALLIDGLDWVTLPLALFPPAEEGAGIAVDTIQALAAYTIFDDPLMWGMALPEVLVPQVLDKFMPFYTGRYIYKVCL